MTSTATTSNAKKVAQIEQALAEMLAATLKRGFFGTAAVEVSVQPFEPMLWPRMSCAFQLGSDWE